MYLLDLKKAFKEIQNKLYEVDKILSLEQINFVIIPLDRNFTTNEYKAHLHGTIEIKRR